MRFAIDLDGTVYKFQKTYTYMLQTYRGLDVPPYKEWWVAWDSFRQWGTKADHDWMFSRGVEKGLFRYGHMIRDARFGLESIAEMGHELVVVTHRPSRAVQDTLEWISLYFKSIPLEGVSILSSGEPKTSVEWDVLIDDKPENISDALLCKPYGRGGILFSQPWNKDHVIHEPYPAVRAYGWKDVVDIVKREGWK